MKREELVKLPHGFVGGFDGQKWLIWESIEDFDRNGYPYEAVCEWKRGQKVVKPILTEAEARTFANKLWKSWGLKEVEG